jgi:hypothetical protein
VATRSVKVGAAVVAGAIVAAVAFKLGSSTVDTAKRTAATQTTATTTPDLVEFRDDTSGWAISYPNGWKRQPVDPADRDVALVASEDDGRGSIKVRDVDLGAPVEEAKQRALTDQLVNKDGIRPITEPAAVHQAGLAGTFYFYSFVDSASGQEGVHSHYFLFKGSRMIVIVFQALPKDDFRRLANLFDEVIGSFRLL